MLYLPCGLTCFMKSLELLQNTKRKTSSYVYQEVRFHSLRTLRVILREKIPIIRKNHILADNSVNL